MTVLICQDRYRFAIDDALPYDAAEFQAGFMFVLTDPVYPFELTVDLQHSSIHTYCIPWCWSATDFVVYETANHYYGHRVLLQAEVV